MTVTHRKKIFDTAILRPYGMTKRICGCYYGDECDIAIVSGMPEDRGKMSCMHRSGNDSASRSNHHPELYEPTGVVDGHIAFVLPGFLGSGTSP